MQVLLRKQTFSHAARNDKSIAMSIAGKIDSAQLRLASTNRAQARGSLSTLLALAIGVSITLCVYGYQFGRSNHTVYLLLALPQTEPPILACAWFVTTTFHSN